MQSIPLNKRVLIIGLLVLFIGIVALMIYIAVVNSGKNQFGGFVKIQNYDQKIKNLPSDMKDSMQSSLYNTVKLNVPDEFDPATIKDAFIRESTDSQVYEKGIAVYSGSFVIDIESMKQSYDAQYSYSANGTLDTGGNPVVISCLAPEKLKYGDFDCKDLVSGQSTGNAEILQYLPYENFSFKISPDTTADDGHLILRATLRIPESDLAGNADSRKEVVNLYKNEVKRWLLSKKLDPKDYDIQYDYSDNGDYIGKQ